MTERQSLSMSGYLRFEISQYLIRKRWLVVPPAMLFVAWFSTDIVQARSYNHNVRVNVWDELFGVFGNGNVVFVGLTTLFLFLISDVMEPTSLNAAVLMRVGSRKKWWIGKGLVLGLSALVYLGMITATVFTYAAFHLPLEKGWSEGARQIPNLLFIASGALARSPATVFLQLSILLGLGWLGLGLLVALIVQCFHNTVVAFMVGLIVNLSGFLTFRVPLPFPFSLITLDRHLLYGLHAFGDRSSPYPSVVISGLYWLVWLTVCFSLGYHLSVKRDIL